MKTHSHKHLDGTVTEDCPCVDLDALAISLQDALDQEERRRARPQLGPATYRDNELNGSTEHWKEFTRTLEEFVNTQTAHAKAQRKVADLLGQSSEWLWFSALLLVLCSIAAWVNW